MIFFESVTVPKGNTGGSCDHTCLSHPSPHALTKVTSLSHHFPGPAEHRTHRSAKSLGEAELNGVGRGGKGISRHSGGDHGIEKPSAVEMNRQAMASGGGAGLHHQIVRHHLSPGKVVGV